MSCPKDPVIAAHNAADTSDVRCPDCGADFRASHHRREGWHYARCGRRWHPTHGWERSRPRICLGRELEDFRRAALRLPLAAIGDAGRAISDAAGLAGLGDPAGADKDGLLSMVDCLSGPDFARCVRTLWFCRRGAADLAGLLKGQRP